jgi:hypothetical protein
MGTATGTPNSNKGTQETHQKNKNGPGVQKEMNRRAQPRSKTIFLLESKIGYSSKT